MKEKKSKCKDKVSSIGGQALMEGVMMRGKTAMAMAVRTPDGEILMETTRVKKRGAVYKIPVLRGLLAFFSSMVSGVGTLLKSAEVSSPEEEVPSKGIMGFAVVLGLLLGVGIFILLPSFLSSILFSKLLKLENILLFSLCEGLLRITIFVLYLYLVSKMKDIRRTFMYHGAEHRTINCYEKGLEMTVENVQSCSTRHNRCGTTFLFFVMLLSILLFSLVNYVFAQLGLNGDNYTDTQIMLMRMGVRLALLPLVAGLSYELLKLLASLPSNAFVTILRAPGLALQRLTTYLPTDDMAEVALKSFMAVLQMDDDPSIAEVKFNEIPILSVKERIKSELSQTNADASEPDWILCDVLKVRRSNLHEVKTLSLKQLNAVKKILQRRKNNEPLWYILGYTDFFAQRLFVDNSALIPRPETELLAEAAIGFIANEPKKVLDLCTGSGCIALAIIKNTNASVTASDFSDKALELAKKNLKDGARIVHSDMFAAFEGEKFDLIVCNPPYIRTADIQNLDKEIKDFEPVQALDGGEDGLKFYRILATQATQHLEGGGAIMVELGEGQADEVTQLFAANGFVDIKVTNDYSGCQRIISAYRGSENESK